MTRAFSAHMTASRAKTMGNAPEIWGAFSAKYRPIMVGAQVFFEGRHTSRRQEKPCRRRSYETGCPVAILNQQASEILRTSNPLSALARVISSQHIGLHAIICRDRCRETRISFVPPSRCPSPENKGPVICGVVPALCWAKGFLFGKATSENRQTPSSRRSCAM